MFLSQLDEGQTLFDSHAYRDKATPGECEPQGITAVRVLYHAPLHNGVIVSMPQPSIVVPILNCRGAIADSTTEACELCYA